MTSSGRRVYLDSCVYIELFTASRAEQFETAVALVKRALRGEFVLVASELVRVEVAKLGVDRVDDVGTLAQFFDSPTFLWVQLDRTIANSARKLVSEDKLRPADAVHLCSAQAANVETMCTWDNRLLKMAEDPTIEVDVCSPETFPGQGQLPL